MLEPTRVSFLIGKNADSKLAECGFESHGACQEQRRVGRKERHLPAKQDYVVAESTPFSKQDQRR